MFFFSAGARAPSEWESFRKEIRIFLVHKERINLEGLALHCFYALGWGPSAIKNG